MKSPSAINSGLPHSRRVLVSSLQSSTEGLPVSISDSGLISIHETATLSQFQFIADAIDKCSSASTTLFNFAKGDIWNAACSRYGGGRQLMIHLYSEEFASIQAMAWRKLGEVARKVPAHDRDISRSWRYYRHRYNVNEEGPTKLYEESVPTDSFVARQFKGNIKEVCIRNYTGSKYTLEVSNFSGEVHQTSISIQELAEWSIREVKKASKIDPSVKIDALALFDIDPITGEIS